MTQKLSNSNRLKMVILAPSPSVSEGPATSHQLMSLFSSKGNLSPREAWMAVHGQIVIDNRAQECAVLVDYLRATITIPALNQPPVLTTDRTISWSYSLRPPSCKLFRKGLPFPQHCTSKVATKSDCRRIAIFFQNTNTQQQQHRTQTAHKHIHHTHN